MKKCAHTVCICPEATYVQAGVNFCSQTCADAAQNRNLADAICACIHADCHV